jgi:hypothetical protein
MTSSEAINILAAQKIKPTAILIAIEYFEERSLLKGAPRLHWRRAVATFRVAGAMRQIASERRIAGQRNFHTSSL